MKTLRQHQQAAARAPRGTKGKPISPAALAARRANAARATAARKVKAAPCRWEEMPGVREAAAKPFAESGMALPVYWHVRAYFGIADTAADFK